MPGIGKPGIDGQSAWDKTEQAIFTSFFVGASTALAGSPQSGKKMTDDTDTRDRVIRLETNLEHVTEQLADMQKKVNAMHDLLMQARGVRWIIIAMAAMAGFIASFASKYLHFPLSK